MSSKRQKNETVDDVDEIATEIKCPLRIFFSNTSDDDTKNSSNASTSSTLPVEQLLPFLDPKDVYCISQVCKAANDTVHHKTQIGRKLLKLDRLSIKCSMLKKSDDTTESIERSNKMRRVVDSVYLEGLSILQFFPKYTTDLCVLLYLLKSAPNLRTLKISALILKLSEEDFAGILQGLVRHDKLEFLMIRCRKIPFTTYTAKLWVSLTQMLNKTLLHLAVVGMALDKKLDSKDAAKMFSSLKNLKSLGVTADAEQLDKDKRVPFISEMLLAVCAEKFTRIRGFSRICAQLTTKEELMILCKWVAQLPLLKTFSWGQSIICQRFIDGEQTDFEKLMLALEKSSAIETIKVPIACSDELTHVCKYIRKTNKIQEASFVFHPEFVDELCFARELATTHSLKKFRITRMKCCCSFCSPVEDEEEVSVENSQ